MILFKWFSIVRNCLKPECPIKTQDLRKLANRKKISKLGEDTQVTVQSPLQKLVYGNSIQNLLKSRHQSFLVLPDFAWFSFFFFVKYFVTDFRWDLTTTQMRLHQGGLIFLHLNSFHWAVPPRRDCYLVLPLCFLFIILN